MKTYQKVLPILGIIFGLLGLLVILSFATLDSCNNSKHFPKAKKERVENR